MLKLIKKIKSSRGVTLIELIAVIVIIGILAVIAVPAYNGFVESSRESEARQNLNILYMAEKIHFLNNRTYWPAAGATTTIDAAQLATVNSTLNCDLALPSFYTIAITNSTTTTGANPVSDFRVVATRTTDQTKAFCINKSGSIVSANTC